MRALAGAAEVVLVLVILLAAGYGLVNGVHDAGNAVAAPVMTRALRPGPAVALAAVFHVVGALTAGTAVAATVGGIVGVAPARALPVLGAAVTAAMVWNLLTLWWGLPCSSGHCLVGALAGAALAEGGVAAVHWGGLDGIRPEGVVGSLVWLAFSAAVAVPLAFGVFRLARRSLQRASRAIVGPVRVGEVGTSVVLAFAHGSNDSQKTMGVMTAALVAGGSLSHFAVPWWVAVVAAVVLSVGTSLGGWGVARTLGRGIYRLRPLGGLASQATSGGVVLAASVVGAPISTTDVVAPAVVGVGAGEHWHRVRWSVVRTIALAWLVTLPVSGALAALLFPLWRWAG